MKKFLLAATVVASASLVAFTTTSKTESANTEAAVLAADLPTAGNWSLDAVHSNVKFTVSHLVISEVDGHFKMFDGTMTNAKADFTDAKIEFTVDVASISTDNSMRDDHLKSDDFFNAAKFPKMKFVSKSFKKVSGNKYELAGDLTIRDVTKPVIFAVTYGGIVKDPYGNIKTGFKAKSTINRKTFGLKWSAVTEAGGVVVGDDVDINLNIQLAKKG